MIALDAVEQIDHPMKVHLVNEVAGTIAAIAKDLGEQQ